MISVHGITRLNARVKPNFGLATQKWEVISLKSLTQGFLWKMLTTFEDTDHENTEKITTLREILHCDN